MRPLPVVMHRIPGEHTAQVSIAEDQHSPAAPHPLRRAALARHEGCERREHGPWWARRSTRPRAAGRGTRRPWWRTCDTTAGPTRAPAGRSSTTAAAIRRDRVRPAITVGHRPKPDFWHPTGRMPLPRCNVSEVAQDLRLALTDLRVTACLRERDMPELSTKAMENSLRGVGVRDRGPTVICCSTWTMVAPIRR